MHAYSRLYICLTCPCFTCLTRVVGAGQASLEKPVPSTSRGQIDIDDVTVRGKTDISAISPSPQTRFVV